jgi:hypothetical protein
MCNEYLTYQTRTTQENLQIRAKSSPLSQSFDFKRFSLLRDARRGRGKIICETGKKSLASHEPLPYCVVLLGEKNNL